MTIALDGARLRDGALLDVPSEARAGSSLLRWSLRGTDLAALVLAWTAANLLWADGVDGSLALRTLITTLPIAVVGVWLINGQDLYLARVATMRTVEQARLVRVCVLLAGVALGAEWLAPGEVHPGFVFTGAGLSLVGLIASRTGYRAWLTWARASGRFIRPVVLVGIDHQAQAIRRVLDEQPELGFSVVGAVGTYASARSAEMTDIWLGEVDEVTGLVGHGLATGAVVSSTALDPDTVNTVTRSLLSQHCHVHLSAGISGVDQRRLRPVHVGYEPLLYVEPVDLTRAQLVAKRTIDVAVSLLVAVVVAPVLLAGAVAIKLDSRGPVLFRQRRVGRGGELFTVLKLRTMYVDAEEHLEHLLADNERAGPLFKIEDDPRVTRVGRLLRALSIDELPQLVNVLRGDMSLVGPRPALPSEVEAFDERLRTRTRVLPGITGLWQVEARDNPSFHAYERLDLFYVENWSVGLDVMIVIATVENELARLLRRLVRRDARAAPRNRTR